MAGLEQWSCEGVCLARRPGFFERPYIQVFAVRSASQEQGGHPK
jgi:hypothetical protein